VGRLEEQSDRRCAGLELLDGDERLVVAVGELIVLREDAEAASGDLEAADDADLQVVELDFAVESGAQGFDDPTLEDWAGVCEDDLNDDDESDDCEYEAGNTPAPGFRYACTQWLSGALKLDRVSVPALT